MNKTCQHILLYSAISVIASCAGFPAFDRQTDQATLSREKRNEQVLSRDNWTLKARVAVKVERQAWSATLNWQQQAHQYRLQLIGPLGKGTIELYSQQQTVTLRTADNQLLQAESAEVLLQEHFGWSLPVAAMRYWIRGIPQPDTAVTVIESDQYGRLERLRQSGWNISYDHYLSVDELELPGRLSLENDSVRVKLSVKDWTLL